MPDRILHNILIKDLLIGGVSFVLAILLPVLPLAVFAGFLIFADTCTGIWAARVRGEKFHSSKLKRALAKVALYPLIIAIASLAEYFLPGIPFTTGGAVLIIVVECVSILENASDILGYNLLRIVKAWISNDTDTLLDFKNKRNERKDKIKDK